MIPPPRATAKKGGSADTYGPSGDLSKDGLLPLDDGRTDSTKDWKDSVMVRPSSEDKRIIMSEGRTQLVGPARVPGGMARCPL